MACCEECEGSGNCPECDGYGLCPMNGSDPCELCEGEQVCPYCGGDGGADDVDEPREGCDGDGE